ncbi:DUF4199 domain-containing protein [Emticicia sp. SJ17W-69]|uniref:DUF4199 domain-containing protein n=1 Tax=Emticicia sp. SJ17W-69 TaxID=3421657 RepID=UPI003EBF9061
MKKIVLVNGAISGIIVSLFLVFSVGYCYATSNFQGNMWVGYASMLLAFSLTFVGIKNFRDKQNEGVISFGKAFQIGLYISLIASSFYVITWLIDYYFFIPDFMEKFGGQAVESAKSSGASASEISKISTEIESYKEMYKTPLGVILLTYMEILPVGLVVSLISALILKKK